MCTQQFEVGWDLPDEALDILGENVPWVPCGKVLLPCLVEMKQRLAEKEIAELRAVVVGLEAQLAGVLRFLSGVREPVDRDGSRNVTVEIESG